HNHKKSRRIMAQANSHTSVALIVGVTGMAGLSLAEGLKKPTAPGSPWKVYGMARRQFPTWFPSALLDGFVSADVLNHDDTTKKLAPLASQVTHVFWVAIQVGLNEQENITSNATMLTNVLQTLKSDPTSPLRHITLQTGTKHYMGPIFDPTLAGQLVSHEPPFREDMQRLPYPNFYYALEDLVASYSPSVTYSVHRSSIIVGSSTRSFYNTLLTIAVYATICRYQGLPFRYPGSKYTWEHFCDMSDAEVLAQQHIWAAVTDKAKNQVFNCTNGDVFTWKSLWRVLCEAFGVEFVPFDDDNDGFDWVGLMKDKEEVWEEIVGKHGLIQTRVKDITCPEALSAVLHFGFQHVCSMNKSREFGFFGTITRRIMAQADSQTSVALIVGVTGMAGLSLAEALKKPTAAGSPWKVYGVARRQLPAWFPSALLDVFISADALDREDTTKKLAPLASQVTHVFWVAIQVGLNEQENITSNATMLTNVLQTLKSDPSSPLRHITLQTGTQHYMGPIHDPSLSAQLIQYDHHEPPFKEDVPRFPYPNFYCALEDLVASYSPSITYSVHRSSIIVGASSRSFYNTLLTLAVYATICRYQGLPFRYPGSKYTWEHFCDMSDAEVLAQQHLWAAVTDKAKNQAFNCTNGDVFTWKSLWRVLCEVFDVEFVGFDDEDEKFDWIGLMKDKEDVWEEIMEKYGLIQTRVKDVTCPEALSTVLHFSFQHVCSMNKSREFGFFGYADTLKSIPMWVQRLRAMKIIP
ncbi:hypothetical protein Tsubulata_033630, partial [Turnera subulata]